MTCICGYHFVCLCLAAGIVVAFVGIVIMHDLRQQPWINWLLPAVLLLGLLLAAGTVLEVLKYKVSASLRPKISNTICSVLVALRYSELCRPIHATRFSIPQA